LAQKELIQTLILLKGRIFMNHLTTPSAEGILLSAKTTITLTMIEGVRYVEQLSAGRSIPIRFYLSALP